MRITSIELKNFKRFTHLKLTDIATNARLVLLVGANGSGKSSVFDAFEFISRTSKRNNHADRRDYYRKDKDKDFSVSISLLGGEILQAAGDGLWNNETAKRFYGRSSLRIEPQINNSGRVNQIAKDEDAPDDFSSFDRRFQQDVFQYIQDIDSALREPVFRGEQANTLEIYQRFIKPLNDSLFNIFGQNEGTVLKLLRFQNADTNTPPKLIFQKGNQEVNYDLLSHGEKQVIILLLNFIVRNKLKENTIYFIDEMDVHLNTALQYNLIKEVYENYIPNNAQLWTASHSLGFINFASSQEEAAMIDFGSYNFDYEIDLKPADNNNYDVFEVAVPKDTLTRLFAGKKIILCENKNDQYYNLLNIENTLFVGVLNSNAVFIYIKRDEGYFGLRDRDYLSDGEIAKLKAKFPNYYILEYYSFENYLYHPLNVEELGIEGFDRGAYEQDIINQKISKQITIITDLKKSRDGYEEFKVDIAKDANVESITHDLLSDDFDRFYKYFNMRDKFDKSNYQKFINNKSALANTNWFKTQISAIING